MKKLSIYLMVTPIRVFTKRPTPLKDQNVVYIRNFNTEFNVELWQQVGNEPPTKLVDQKFTPTTVTPTPEPEPEPPVIGNVIWDSLKDGKWDQARTVDDSFGDIGPNGKGFHMRASGNPVLEIKGNNEAHLKCEPGHGRMYGACCNYNSRLELEFAFLNAGVDNLSIKLRCRHQMGGAPENRFGGVGCSISLDDVSSKIENYHNVHSSSVSEQLPEKLKVGTRYKATFTCQDSSDKKSIEVFCEIDGKNVLSAKHDNPEPYFMDKAKFEEHSEFWIRQNNEADGTIGLKNVKLIAL